MLRKIRSARAAHATAAAAVTLAAAGAALANNGTQLPLNSIQAGTEQTSSAVVTNGTFESPGVPGPTATGWDRIDDMSVGAPLPALPNPPSVLGSFTARGGLEGAKYFQNVTLQ